MQTTSRTLATETFRLGQRVAAHSATDAFMAGDRYGTVEKIGRRVIWTRMDRSGRLRGFRPMDLIPVD